MHMLSRNQCNMYPTDRFLVLHSTTYGMSSHYGRLSHRPRLGVFSDRSRAKPTIDSFFATRVTTFHQAHESLHLDHADLAQSTYRLTRNTAGLFLSQPMTVLRAI